MADESCATTSELEETFARAANHLQTMVSSLDSGQLLAFYGLYKQATVGVCDTARPSWYQTQAKYKWEAWKALGDMGKEVAMNNYIRAITKLDPDWEQEAKIGSKSWNAVSSLLKTDIELSDAEKTLLDWVKDGNDKKVWEILSTYSTSLNVPGEDGMMPIHWAADRGHLPTIKCLIENGANVDAQDEDGQTALHYAASCGHADVVKYLLSIGAKLLQDNDGFTPKDIADKDLIAMF
ncbi:acyl-CoA-binding domain-containing protein 6 [Microplitis demolitor]|uniref:acyl-CoA-binding domain-containing protein 6 n=1 Tax=Microplitis demolitor TaxID=69319 RepID=UPI0004CD2B1C|nr:acyl-CoA-binding domain-containing protein 6 [Microplitis demolitor]